MARGGCCVDLRSFASSWLLALDIGPPHTVADANAIGLRGSGQLAQLVISSTVLFSSCGETEKQQ